MRSYSRTGFQASSLGEAIDVINRMVRFVCAATAEAATPPRVDRGRCLRGRCQRAWRLSDEPVADDEAEERRDPAVRSNTRCLVFLAYTSNLVSSGLRETIRYLVQHKMVSREGTGSTRAPITRARRGPGRSMCWSRRLAASRRTSSSAWRRPTWATSACPVHSYAAKA